MVLLLTIKILFLNLLHRNNFRDCHFYSSSPWLFEMLWSHNIHFELHIKIFFLAVRKLIVITYLSFCNLQFGSFKPSQSNFRAEASNFVSLNSRSVSHWLVLRTAASAPQEAGDIRHRYNLQRKEEWPHHLVHALPTCKEKLTKNDNEQRQQNLLLSVTSMSVRHSLAALILHTEASFLNLPGYFLQTPNLSNTG